MKRTIVLLTVACCMLLVARAVNAQVPHLIRYQGQAVDTNGVPLEGPYTLTFRLYNTETGGTKIWEEAQSNTQLAGGHFSVLLGQQTSLTSMNWDQPCWLSIQVNADPELIPRQRITSVPMAIRAQTADQLTTPAALASKIVTFTRTAAAGAGVQAVTGFGFQPKAIFAVCTDASGWTSQASWAMADETGRSGGLAAEGGTPRFTPQVWGLGRLALVSDGVGTYMIAALDRMDPDGFTVTWMKSGIGFDVSCEALGVR